MPPQKNTPLTTKKKWTFTLVAATLPALFFIFLELGLRLFGYGGDLHLFISARGEYTKYYMCNPIVARRYFFMQNTVPDPPNDLFLKQKPENGYRIFVLGGSTTAGYPYANNIMFSRILQQRLADVFPDRAIEVVNTAMTAVNSYTLLDFMDEILEKQPDAILIYAGHNEFYGALGAGSNESLGKYRSFVKVYLRLQRLKTFLMIRDAVGKARKWLNRVLYQGDVSKPSSTLMERMVAKQTIPLDSPLYERGRQQFEKNLRDIIMLAHKAGVEIMVSELVSNVRHSKPFISVKTDSLPSANEIFARARKLENERKYDAAREKYLYAKDLDALRFRATEDFNAVVRSIAKELQVPCVPMVSYFESASPHGLIGNNLILEHLHPNVDGYFIMADAFFDTMRKAEFISTNWDTSKIRPSDYYRKIWGFTELDRSYADIRVRILKGNWPFKPKNVPNLALIDYQPTSKVDSIALKAWSDDSYNLERGHVDLAQHYESGGKFLQALAEYKALIRITPFNASPYLHAADVLIKARKLEPAVVYLRESLAREQTVFANKWLGQIFLDQGKTKVALPYLEKAAEQAPNDAQLVYNLSGAYALDHQFDRAKAALKHLDKLSPNFPGAADLKRQLARIPF